MASARQLDELAKLGDDHAVERPVDHFVVLPSRAAADAAVAALRDAGFDADVAPDGPLVTATRAHAVDLHSLERALAGVFAAVEPHGGEYDGWGAPVAGGATPDDAPRPPARDAGTPTSDEGTAGHAGARDSGSAPSDGGPKPQRRRFWRR